MYADPPTPPKPDYGHVQFKALEKGGHRRCWRFMTHPEGWVDNVGVLAVVLAPLGAFWCILLQDAFPSIFVLGTCNIISIAVSLLVLVPDSRKVSTYSSAQNMSRLLNFHKQMTPNSWRHMFVLASWLFQLLVLTAVVITECRVILETLVPYLRKVEAQVDVDPDSQALLYRFAEALSTSVLGNAITLVLTTVSATFFGFAWFVGCFEDR